MSPALFGLICFLSSTAMAAVFTPLVIRSGKSLGLVDQPHVRKVHRSPTPRVGGIAIVSATLITLAFALFRERVDFDSDHLREVLTLLVGAASVAIVGVLDDVVEIKSKYKLVALLAASIALCGSGAAVRQITVNGVQWIDLGMAAWPLTVIWIVGVTVSINFIDGLDGLAGGISLVTCGVMAMSAGASGDVGSVTIALALAGALCGFLIYNTHPAKVFMGDGGSMFLGFLIAGTCVLMAPRAGATHAIVLPSFALIVPLLDTFLTMIRRGVLQRRSLFAAERGHVHHRLMDIGLSHWHTVLLLYAVTLSAAAVSVIWLIGGYWASLTAVIVLGSFVLIVFRLGGSVRAKDTVSAIRRNRALKRENNRYQHAFYDMQLRFREVQNFNSWWQQICHAADLFDFAKIDLPITRRDGSTTTLRWRRDQELLAHRNSITAEVPIPQRRNDETLRAAVEVTVIDFLESAGHRVALFSRLMSDFGLDQLDRPDRKRTAKRAIDQDPHVDLVASPALRPAAVGALPHLRIALVHDFLYTYAGAERVLEQLVEVFPQADIFSLFDFLPKDQRGFIHNKPVQTSFLQKMPFARRKHRAYLPLMPLAIEQLDMSGYDLVLSSSYMAAKGVITRPDQLHVCYCHTPVRFAWDMQTQYLGQTGLTRGLRSIAVKMILQYIRNFDVRSSNGVDAFIANSNFVGRRIHKVYRRESTTIYPPVDTGYFTLDEEKHDYYLTASRMVPYKRIDLIVEAFSKMPDRRLVVVGDGPEMEKIRGKAGPNVTLLGQTSAESLKRHMQHAKAFLFAAEEDFGIAPVEAQACGTPVIAFGRGGVTESVIVGKTGVFFDKQTTDAIVDAVRRFDDFHFTPAEIRTHAERFSIEQFRTSIAEYVSAAWALFERNGSSKGDAMPPAADLPMPTGFAD